MNLISIENIYQAIVFPYREAFKNKKTAYFMISGKKVGGPLTKTKFQKNIEIWTNSYWG